MVNRTFKRFETDHLEIYLQERKRLVKEAQKEKRQSKVPKHVKKRKEKLAKQGKKK